MTVTDITELSKAKVKVCMEDGSAFALYKNELKKFHIEKDKELSKDCYQYLMEDILPKRAKCRCMNLLKSRDYTECQIRAKLKQGFYPDKVIEDAVAYVSSYGYIDDARYANLYIEHTSNTKSRKQIENNLLGKGISKEIIEQIYEQYTKEEDFIEEEDVIKNLLIKKRYNSQNATYKERQKMIAFLYRRWFSLDQVYKAVGELYDII